MIGSRLGSYEVLDTLGAGGMGEVYRARDTRLERVVALKVLAAPVARDPQFRERFEREARTISQLNHPHICTLYDIGRHDDTAFLVMECLEGETLAHRLERGPLPVEQAVQSALEIAAALEAAHRQGVVHRDLKPGNVMLTKGGAKLLDFGLAKAGVAALAAGGVTAAAPTAAPLTAQGTILGTFQYMAPEQLEGNEADARADIWAFGCVLYEMLTGRRAFEGKSHAGLLSAILKDQPPSVSQAQPLTPPALDYVVRTCLAKDPDARFATMHDVRLQLQWIHQGGSAAGLAAPVVAHRRRRASLAWTATTVLAVAAAAGLTTWWVRPPASAPPVVMRSEYPLPDGQGFTRPGRHVLALSPDGTKLAYVANQQLYLRALNQLEAQPVRGTHEDPMEPVFSPDGAWLAYFVPGKGASAPGDPWILKKVAVAGGTPVALAQIAGMPFGATWGSGLIVFGTNAEGAYGVQAVPEGGGPPRMLASVDPATERAAQPRLLNDGRDLLFVVGPPAGGDGQIVVQPTAGGERRVLVTAGADPHVLPTGHLVYVRDGSLYALPFDASRLAVRGDPVLVLEDLMYAPVTWAGQFAIAANGTLAGVRSDTADSRRRLVWVDRNGRETPLAAPPRAYLYPRISPDGTKIAVSSIDEEYDIWMFDLAKESLTRFTFGPAAEVGAIWTPDSRHLIFSSADAALAASPKDIFRRAADGTGPTEALTQNRTGGGPQSVSPDGQWLVFFKGAFDIFVAPLQPGGEPRPLLAHPAYHEVNGEISPDGRWIAYQSSESGRPEIYVRPFPDIQTGLWQISSGGGRYPMWARSGRELFYLSSEGALLAVPVESGTGFSHARAQELFDARPYFGYTVARPFDVSPDGRRFFMSRAVADDTSLRPSVVIVSNWFEELKARVPIR